MGERLGSVSGDGDAREAVKALIVANHFLETELEKLRTSVSTAYARGKLLPRDRKDWHDSAQLHRQNRHRLKRALDKLSDASFELSDESRLQFPR